MPGPYFADDIKRTLDSAALSGAAWARMQLPASGPCLAWVLAGYYLGLCVVAVALGVEWRTGSLPGGKR